MKHLFDVDIAIEYGTNAAILLENIAYWIKQNEANEVNYYDGEYWTFNSRRAYAELFPYMSKRQIETAFEKLIDGGLLKTGNYNKLAYDRTLWYALTQKGKSILQIGIMHCTETEKPLPQNVKSITPKCEMEKTKQDNGLSQNVSPIQNINTDINADVNTKNNILSEFETLWKLYPRKIGKPKALKAYQKARKNGVTFEDVKQGIENYNAEIKAKGTGTDYIKHGSTWFYGECWGDEYAVKETSPYANLKGGLVL